MLFLWGWSWKLTFELRNEQSKEVTNISGNSRCKGPGVGSCLAFSRTIRVAEGSQKRENGKR